MKITIVGLGLMGGSIAKDLSALRLSEELWGVEQNSEYQKQVIDLNLVDQLVPLQKGVLNRDLVILSLPVHIILQELPGILDQIAPETTIVDLGSTKFEIVQSVLTHPKRNQYVAAHPMAGTEHSGPLAALSGLYRGRTVVFCDIEQSSEEHLQRASKLFEILGARIVFMNSKEHDLHVAFVSHLSHISSFVLANTVLNKEKDDSTIFSLAGGGFESTVRLAKSSPAMWGPIFEQNQTFVLEALNSYINELQVFYDHLKSQQYEALMETMIQANEIRRILPQLMPSPGEKR